MTFWTLAALALQGEASGFVDKTIDYKGTPTKYVVYVPKEYRPGTPHPAILFLHGAGETGTDGRKQTTVGLGPAIRQAPAAWNFIVLFPQAPPSGEIRNRWMAHEELVLAILEAARKEYSIDETRLYGTGLSMGGFGTWRLAAKHPKLFAAIAPICGGGDPAEAARLKDISIWAFHGDQDRAVPHSLSVQMVEAVKAAGGNPKLTIYPGVGHNCWDKAYREESLAEWFLQHRRP